MKYIALTIGPIYKTLKNAKKTRELWGGSYIFSYIMKQIISKFKDRDFVTPYTQEDSIFKSGNEVGLFHDRFIFASQDRDKEQLQKAIEEVLEELAKNTSLSLEFLKAYFQINFIEADVKENPIIELTPFLDSVEQFYKIGHYKENELSKMLKGNNSFLTKEAFGEKKSFPSLPEIATCDLKNTINIKALLKDDELEIYEDKELKKHLKPYHKYIAIVHADGDSMSEVIKDTNKLSDTSKNLFEYCIASHKLISDFGGQTIFAGGDDLLFFAPVVNSNKTIFELLDDISRLFDEKFQPKATLSFGLSITYYKFPLYEALEKSRDLLFGKAKQSQKNNIAYEVVKHSGQTFGGVVHKGGNAYEKFLEFVSIEKSLDDNFLHSLHHKIDLHKTTLEAIKHDDKKPLNFFKNYFNEANHDEYKEFFEKLISYIKEEQNLNNIYATLRFVKFIKGDKE
ncbi:MAG: type III-B CRISPR-associated protein Cas10/Cmr2 [Arcobacter sp.]|nr:type III-B CRISPR-associated protein Cas10/Cmr2 [Arcobacter sp.]